MPGRFDAIFVISFAVALIGIAVLVLLVDDRRGADGERASRVSLDLPGLLRNRPFVSIAGVAALTSFVVVSDAFLYLLLQWRRGGGAETIPLLYAGTASAYLVLAAPLGRLADRVGRARVFLIGQALHGRGLRRNRLGRHRALDAGARACCCTARTTPPLTA